MLCRGRFAQKCADASQFGAELFQGGSCSRKVSRGAVLFQGVGQFVERVGPDVAGGSFDAVGELAHAWGVSFGHGAVKQRQAHCGVADEQIHDFALRARIVWADGTESFPIQAGRIGGLGRRRVLSGRMGAFLAHEPLIEFRFQGGREHGFGQVIVHARFQASA